MPRQRPFHFMLSGGSPFSIGLVAAYLAPASVIGSTQYRDSSRWSHHGTMTSMDPATDWIFDSWLQRWVLDFDGSNDYVSIGTGDVFQPKPMSVALWFSTTGTPADYDSLIGKRGANWTTGGGWHVAYNLSTMRFMIESYGANFATVAYTPTTDWHHFAGVWDGTTISVYLDGKIGSVTDTFTGDFTGTTNLFSIGQVTSGTYAWPGKIADVLLYQRALSLCEIGELADPSNSLLSGLILTPRRIFFGGGVLATTDMTLLSVTNLWAPFHPAVIIGSTPSSSPSSSLSSSPSESISSSPSSSPSSSLSASPSASPSPSSSPSGSISSSPSSSPSSSLSASVSESPSSSPSSSLSSSPSESISSSPSSSPSSSLSASVSESPSSSPSSSLSTSVSESPSTSKSSSPSASPLITNAVPIISYDGVHSLVAGGQIVSG